MEKRGGCCSLPVLVGWGTLKGAASCALARSSLWGLPWLEKPPWPLLSRAPPPPLQEMWQSEGV